MPFQLSLFSLLTTHSLNITLTLTLYFIIRLVLLSISLTLSNQITSDRITSPYRRRPLSISLSVSLEIRDSSYQHITQTSFESQEIIINTLDQTIQITPYKPMQTKTPPSPMGHLSLHTSFSSSPPNSASYARSDCSTVSPLSSTTTSPASSPTSPFRRLCRPAWFPASDNKIDTSLITTTGTEEKARSRSRSQSQASFRLNLNHHLNALRRPSSSLLFLLRRRPSKIDLALSEERTRCDEDAVERKGVGLLEPRPVDPAPAPVPDMSIGGEGGLGSRSSMQSLSAGVLSPVPSTSLPAQPRFVMGGIEEILAGEA